MRNRCLFLIAMSAAGAALWRGAMAWQASETAVTPGVQQTVHNGVEVLKDGKVIYSTEPKSQDVSFQFNDTGDAAQRHYYYVRLQQDNRMTAWSSPLFVNYK